jgi:hypothetical protein
VKVAVSLVSVLVLLSTAGAAQPPETRGVRILAPTEQPAKAQPEVQKKDAAATQPKSEPEPAVTPQPAQTQAKQAQAKQAQPQPACEKAFATSDFVLQNDRELDRKLAAILAGKPDRVVLDAAVPFDPDRPPSRRRSGAPGNPLHPRFLQEAARRPVREERGTLKRPDRRSRI